MCAFRNTWVLGLLLAGLALPCAAQDETAARRFGDDLYVAGSDVRVAQPGLEDVFAMGRTVVVTGNVRETVHAMGRQVRLSGPVGQDAYAAGQEIDVRGTVTGDVTAVGGRIELSGSTGADATLAGREVEITGPVAGDVSLAGETVEISAPIAGSVQIRAERIRFGPGARIGGTLAYWSPNAVAVPATVISADRVTGVRLAERKKADDGLPERPIRFVVGTVVFLILGAILAAIVPARLTQAHERLVERPWLGLLLGVIALSALFGSLLVFLVSIVGIPLVPLVLLAAPIVLVVGYLTAAFALGRLSLGLAKVRPIPGWLGVFTSIATGVVLLAIVRLVPILGWVVLILAVAVGLGAWFMMLVRPRPAGA